MFSYMKIIVYSDKQLKKISKLKTRLIFYNAIEFDIRNSYLWKHFDCKFEKLRKCHVPTTIKGRAEVMLNTWFRLLFIPNNMQNAQTWIHTFKDITAMVNSNRSLSCGVVLFQAICMGLFLFRFINYSWFCFCMTLRLRMYDNVR